MGLTHEEKARLQALLKMKLYKKQFSEEQEEDFNDLLERDIDVDNNLEEHEHNRMKELVLKLYNR